MSRGLRSQLLADVSAAAEPKETPAEHVERQHGLSPISPASLTHMPRPGARAPHEPAPHHHTPHARVGSADHQRAAPFPPETPRLGTRSFRRKDAWIFPAERSRADKRRRVLRKRWTCTRHSFRQKHTPRPQPPPVPPAPTLPSSPTPPPHPPLHRQPRRPHRRRRTSFRRKPSPAVAQARIRGAARRTHRRTCAHETPSYRHHSPRTCACRGRSRVGHSDRSRGAVSSTAVTPQTLSGDPWFTATPRVVNPAPPPRSHPGGGASSSPRPRCRTAGSERGALSVEQRPAAAALLPRADPGVELRPRGAGPRRKPLTRFDSCSPSTVVEPPTPQRAQGSHRSPAGSIRRPPFYRGREGANASPAGTRLLAGIRRLCSPVARSLTDDDTDILRTYAAASRWPVGRAEKACVLSGGKTRRIVSR
ncbi:hypothetical protein EV641_106227 [Rhodococcus sp. SMB37]|nr:hypothetical protein EV641_106227 [Rhodococcus sp. SMB37]